MKVGAAIAEIMKREGFEILCAYPVNHLIEHAAELDIRTVIVRQERIGLHMADAISRVTSGRKLGSFCMQHGPGTENAYGGVAQAFSESIPILVVPGGYPRRTAQVGANYSAARDMRGVSKSAESITSPDEVVNVMRRAMSRLRNGRGGPAIVEVPSDLWNAELTKPRNYKPVVKTRIAPDPEAVKEAVKVLIEAKRPVMYVGQGVHWAEAWPQVKELAEHLAIPVCTSLEGKSAFDETHELSLGSGGVAVPKPAGKTMIHSTLDEAHLNTDIYADVAVLGDASLVLDAMIAEAKAQVKKKRDSKAVAKEIADMHAAWLKEWEPRLTSEEAPFSPYRVLGDLYKTVDVANTIITHDAGSPRDQLSPFWRTTKPLTYIGWGKTTQLGYGLGLAMGAKLAHPDKLCINVWGDAAIGFTGMDFERARRGRRSASAARAPSSRRGSPRCGRRRDQARHCRDAEGQRGAARVHHQEGNGDLAVFAGGLRQHVRRLQASRNHQKGDAECARVRGVPRDGCGVGSLAHLPHLRARRLLR